MYRSIYMVFLVISFILPQYTFSATGVLIDGDLEIKTGNVLKFPDGTTQSSATLIGPQGPVGPQGPAGFMGATGPAGADGVSVASTNLPVGDTNCPYGGTQFTSVSGVSQVCNSTPPAKTPYRWNVFSTYDQAGGWLFGNRLELHGGINPSNWSDSNAVAGAMSGVKDDLRALFTQRGFAGKNALIYSDQRANYSSTDGRIVVVLFRIKNTTSSTINWTPYFYYSAYSSWGETASVTLNGAFTWNSGTQNSSGNLYTNLSLPIPANRTSSVIFVSPSGPATLVSGSVSMRTTALAFYNNSLNLPTGLQFVDDLDTATGGWEQ